MDVSRRSLYPSSSSTRYTLRILHHYILPHCIPTLLPRTYYYRWHHVEQEPTMRRISASGRRYSAAPPFVSNGHGGLHGYLPRGYGGDSVCIRGPGVVENSESHIAYAA